MLKCHFAHAVYSELLRMLKIWKLQKACGRGTRNRSMTCSGLNNRKCKLLREGASMSQYTVQKVAVCVRYCTFPQAASSQHFSREKLLYLLCYDLLSKSFPSGRCLHVILHFCVDMVQRLYRKPHPSDNPSLWTLNLLITLLLLATV